MKHIKNLLLPAVVLLGTSPLHAAGHQESHTVCISPLAMKTLSKTMPSLQNSSVVQNKIQVDEAEYNESAKQVDSIIHHEGVDPVDKKCYTYYENGDVESMKEYNWDYKEKKYTGISFVYYGKGGTSKPEYTIKGRFDSDGKEVMETRYVYDWTDVKNGINFEALENNSSYNFNNVKWDNVTKIEQYENGAWETVSVCKPQIKDSYLQSLAYFYKDGNGNMVMEDSMVYKYNEAHQLVGYSNYSNQEDGSGTYVIQYDSEGNIVWYGLADKSWYIVYEKGDDYDANITHKTVNGEDRIVYSKKKDEVTGTEFDLYENQKWIRYTESEYRDGKLLEETVSMQSSAEGSVYMAFCQRDSLGHVSDGVCLKMTMENNGKTTVADIYYLTEDNKLKFSCTYRMRTVWMDDYTKYEVLYDENDIAYDWDKTCYHNPNPSGISAIRNNSSQNVDERMYDLTGCPVNSKNGIRIINGKKILFK